MSGVIEGVSATPAPTNLQQQQPKLDANASSSSTSSSETAGHVVEVSAVSSPIPPSMTASPAVIPVNDPASPFPAAKPANDDAAVTATAMPSSVIPVVTPLPPPADPATSDAATTAASTPLSPPQTQGVFARLGLDKLIAALFPGPKRDPERYLGKPVNPFYYDESLHSTILQTLKMIVVGLVLFIPRLLVAIFALIIMTSAAALRVVVSGGVQRDQATGGAYPLAGQMVFNVGRFGARLFLLAFGYWWISIDDQRSEADKKRFAPVLACNHCSFIDPFLMAWLEGPMVAAKAELTELPVIGMLCKGLQVIPISREDTTNKRLVSDEIKRRTRWHIEQPKEIQRRHGTFPPLLIFPEATCTNTKSVIQFKLGAFVPRVPVQPVALDFRQRHLDASWVGAPSVALTALRMMCQVYNRVHVTYLPMDDIQNPLDTPPDVAQRVRTSVAAALDVPMSEHNFLDVLLERDVEALRLPVEAVNVEMGALSETFESSKASLGAGRRVDERDTLDESRRNLRAFAAFNKSRNGLLDQDDFAELLGFHRTGAVRLANAGLIHAAFHHWDHDGDGRINFREFLLLTSSVRVSRLVQRQQDDEHRRQAQLQATAMNDGRHHHHHLDDDNGMTPVEAMDRHSRALLHVGGIPHTSGDMATGIAVASAIAADRRNNGNGDDDDDLDHLSDDLRRAFALSFGAFDTDGDGVATLDDVVSVFVRAAPNVSDRDIRALFGHASFIGTPREGESLDDLLSDDDADNEIEHDEEAEEQRVSTVSRHHSRATAANVVVTFEQYMLMCDRYPLLVASLLDQVAVAEAAEAFDSYGDAEVVHATSTAPYA